MTLLDQVALDLRGIITDPQGFGSPVTVTDPDGQQATLVALTNDISLSVDPQTGIIISGRRASVAFSIQALADAGLGEPRGVADGAGRKPWRVQFTTPTGKQVLMKVSSSDPDELGCIVCQLENYKS